MVNLQSGLAELRKFDYTMTYPVRPTQCLKDDMWDIKPMKTSNMDN